MDYKRILTGFFVGFTSYMATFAGGLWLAVLVFIAVVYLAKEYTEILKHKGFLPSFKIIVASSALFALIAYTNRMEYLPFVLTASVVMALLTVLFKGKQPYIANVATTVFGFMYCGWFPLHLVLLRSLGDNCSSLYTMPIPHLDGARYCILMIFAVLFTDSFCYFIGCKFGKHKLAPVISPKKTIEGSIGGTVSCLLVTMVIGFLMGIAWYHCLILGLLMAVFAQLGDLCESMIKRDAGVKDSSNILPGHGGFLDRLDSYILTIPVVYYYIEFFVNTNIFADLFRGLF